MKPNPSTSVTPAHSLIPSEAILFREGSGTSFAGLIDPTITAAFVGATQNGFDEQGEYVLDGSATSRLRIADNAIFRTTRTPSTGDYSIEIIFDWTIANQNDGLTHVIAEKKGDWSIRENGNSINVYRWRNSSTTVDWAFGSSGFGASGIRTHFVVVYTAAGSVKTYVNGTLITSSWFTTTTSLGTQTDANPVALGAADDGTLTSPIRIRKFAVYKDRALSDAEVQTLACDPYVYFARTLYGSNLPVANATRWCTGTNTAVVDGGGKMNVKQAFLMYYEAGDLCVDLPTASGNEANLANGYTVTASVEHDGIHQVTWSGATSITVTPGSTIPRSDPVRRADGSLLIVPEMVWVGVRSFWTVASGVNPNMWTTGYTSGFTDTALSNTRPVVTTTSKVDGSTLTSTDMTLSGTIATSNTFVPGVCSLVGKRTADVSPIIGISLGDSITAGQGDASQMGPMVGGFTARAALRARIAHYNIGMPGETASNASSHLAIRLSQATQIVPMTLDSRVVITIHLGINDASVYTTLLGYLTTIVGLIRAQYPKAHIRIGSITPNATSSDSWHTLANQTPIAFVTGDRISMHDELRYNWQAYGVDGPLIDCNLAVEYGRTGKWTVDGTTQLMPADATHPNATGHEGLSRPVEAVYRDLNTFRAKAIATNVGNTAITLTAQITGGNYEVRTYAWSITSQPSGGAASFSSASVKSPVLTIDKVGDYVLALTVTDRSGVVSKDVLTVTNAGVDATKVLAGNTMLGTAGTLPLAKVMQSAGGNLLASEVLTTGTGAAALGTYVAVSAANVRGGTAFGAASASTGSLAVPATNRVLTGTSVDATTGTLTLPAITDVVSGVVYGIGGNGSTGTRDIAADNPALLDPSEVKSGVDRGDGVLGTMRTKKTCIRVIAKKRRR